jgi:tetratricopeptide (TPR) repeat protein
MASTLYEEAERMYSQAIDIDANNIEALMKRAQLYSAIGRVKESRRDIAKALSLNPYAMLYHNPDFRKNQLALRTFEMGVTPYLEEADAFEKDLVLSVDYMQLLNGGELPPVDLSFLDLAVRSIQSGRLDSALNYLYILEIQSSVSALSEDLHGVIDLRKGDLEAAIVHFSNAIELNPDFAVAYHNRAIVYKQLGAEERSAEDFDRALELNAASTKTLFAKAKLKERMGDINAATRYYAKASKLDNDMPQLHVNYAALLKTTGNYSLAMQEVGRAIDLNRDLVENYYTRGGIYLIYGEYDKAITDFDRYLDAYPEDADALFNRGLAKLLGEEVEDGCADIDQSLLNGYSGPASDISLFMCR